MALFEDYSDALAIVDEAWEVLDKLHSAGFDGLVRAVEEYHRGDGTISQKVIDERREGK
jgi:hypothetical protein